MSFMKPKVVASPPPPPPPPPTPIPQETDPDVREAELELMRKNRKKQGRSSTLLDGALGSGDYGPVQSQKATVLG